MNVLVISQRKILPTLDGALIGTLGLIKYLKDMGANTTLVTFVESEDYNESERSLLLKYVSALYSCPLKWTNTALNLSLKYPNNIRKYTRKSMVRLIEKIKLESVFDVIIIDHLQLFEYARLFQSERIVLHTHNVESNIWAEYAKKCKGMVQVLVSRSARMTYKYECEAFAKADGVIACSDDDLKCFKKMVPSINGAVMHSYNKFDRIKNKEDVLRKSNKIIFVGSYGWYPNQAAAKFLATEMLPQMSKYISDMQLILVGKDPTDEIRNYSLHNPQVIVTGTVESIDSYIKEGDIFVNAVTEGSGINIKMIEAMGKGIPIVSSEYGARGIETHGIEAFKTYRNLDECVSEIIELLEDRKYAYEMTCRAREFYEDFITPSNAVKDIIFG